MAQAQRLADRFPKKYFQKNIDTSRVTISLIGNHVGSLMNSNNPIAIIRCACMLIALQAGLSHAQDFTGHGLMTSTSYKASGDQLSQNEYVFDLAVSGDKWFLRTVDMAIKSGRKSGQASRETGCDGNDTYTKFEFTEDALKRFSEDAKKIQLNKSPAKVASFQIDTNTSGKGVSSEQPLKEPLKHFLNMGDVNPGIFPESEDYFGKVMWFGVLSAGYLSNSPSNAIPSLYQPFSSRSSILQSIKILKYTSSSFRLPLEADLHDSGTKIVRDGKLQKQVQLLPPFDQGFVSGEYRVLETTNVSGVTLPAKFEFFRYTVVQNQTKSSRYLSNKLICAISFDASTGRPNLLPTFDSPALVTDTRFTNEPGGIRYRTETGEFLSKNDPFLRDKTLRLQMNEEPRAAKYLIAALLILLAFVPLYFITRKRLSRNHKQP